MLNALIDHNADLKRLSDEGYELEISNAHLLVHKIPYVNSEKLIKSGIIVSVLSLAGDDTVKPESHAAYFIGDYPCNQDGSKINIVVDSSKQMLGKVEVNHTLSAKDNYPDYYQKITRYINIITAPAMEIDETVTAKTFQVIESEEEDSVFHYADTIQPGHG